VLGGPPISVAQTTREHLEAARILKEKLGLPWGMWDDLVIASQMSMLGIN
jgi:predicted nucleic acid-binding protein